MHCLQVGLRGLSFSTLSVAILTAGFLIARHALPLMTGSQVAIPFKSAVPLIAIGNFVPRSHPLPASHAGPTSSRDFCWAGLCSLGIGTVPD